jgi:hypothetical protein
MAGSDFAASAVLLKFAVIPLSLMGVSCATTVRPPADVADPSTVVVLSHGISSSLILADESGGAVRFAYGDWRYYALGRTGIRETLAAVLWPTTAALGRQVVEGADRRPDDLVAQFGIEYDGKLFVAVERHAVKALRQRLEALFLANIASRVYNPEANLEFVPHPEPYSLCRNSNQMVAQWLTELGATVEGLPILPKWRIKPVHTVH